MTSVVVSLFCAALVLAALLLRYRIAARYHWDRLLWDRWLAFRARLAAREIEREQAARVKKHLRVFAAALAGAALLFLAIWAWRWPAARAQALRIRYQRLEVQEILALRLWQEGRSQLSAVAAQVLADTALSDADRLERLEGIEVIYGAVLGNIRRSGKILDRIHAAEGTIPSRCYPWTMVSDPLTTITAPVSASAGDLQPYILQRLALDATANRWGELIWASSQPGAQPLPPVDQWEGL